MKVKPLGSRVLIADIKPETKTAAGLIIPEGTEKSQMAEVLEVGPGTEENPVTVKKGDKVIYAQYSGTKIKTNDMECRVVDIDDVLAVVED